MGTSAETPDGFSPYSHMATLADQSLISSSSNLKGSSPISAIIPDSVQMLQSVVPSLHMETLGDHSLVPAESNSHGSSSSLHTETQNCQFIDSFPSNQNGFSISFMEILEGQSLALSSSNGTGLSPSSHVETLDDQSLAPPSCNGTGSSPISSVRELDGFSLYSHAEASDDQPHSSAIRTKTQDDHSNKLLLDLKEYDSLEQDTPCSIQSPPRREASETRISDYSFSTSEIEPTGVGAGLANLVNTCFMNAVLQCFTHTVPLVQGLRCHNHTNPFGCGSEGFCVICALYDHIELSLTSSGGIVSPWKFVDNLNHFSSSFRRFQQEDAHEFLQCLLDRLERCCLDSKAKDESLFPYQDNIVERIFGGRLVSKLRCCNCGHCSDTYEPLIDLSLEIEDVSSLPSALESFTKVEKIDDEETKFTCENCKEEVSVEKQLLLDQAPSVATFHLKRFKADGYYVEKIDKHVEFPLELDLQPYTSDSQNSDVDLKYQLYAIVEHIGISSTSGHYFCYIRSSPDIWHRLDDSKVKRVRGEFVLSQDAYILFYARQGTPWFSSLLEVKKPCLDPNISNSSPKSVLDNNVDREYNSYPREENIDTCKANESRNAAEGTSTQFSTRTPHKGVEVNETANSSEGISTWFSYESRENVAEFNDSRGDTPMINASMAFGARDCCGGIADNEKRHMMSFLKENNCVHGTNEVRSNDGLNPPTSPRLPSPEMHSGEPPEAIYCIPRDHLNLEKSGTRKRSLNKAADDSHRMEALRYLKKTSPLSRRMTFVAAMQGHQSEATLNKKKSMKSSPCKTASPASSNRKHNNGPVIRPMAVLR